MLPAPGSSGNLDGDDVKLADYGGEANGVRRPSSEAAGSGKVEVFISASSSRKRDAFKDGKRASNCRLIRRH